MSILIAACAAALACGGGKSQTGDTSHASAAPGGELTAAGATFPEPIYKRWFAEYAAKTGVKINYQAIGSGGGIQQLSQQTVDFAASDAPMSDSEMAAAKGGAIVHIPTVVGLVVLTYNLPGLAQPLRLTGPLIAQVFLGTITKWNDARIGAVNPGVKLPATDILVVHRTDASGTTYIFSDYLSAVSDAWRNGPGKGKSLQWPVGLGGAQNAGVTGQVKQMPGAIGYVELAYAKENQLPAALVQNAAGNFVAPTVAAATAAADGAVAKLPPSSDLRLSIVNAPGATTYPIASFTYLLVYRHMADAAREHQVADFIRWALADGEPEVSALDYAPLPPALVTRLMARVDSLSAPSSAVTPASR
jgi:phosphate transport system substrate-binding protein